jgi:hypothetical protein
LAYVETDPAEADAGVIILALNAVTGSGKLTHPAL